MNKKVLKKGVSFVTLIIGFIGVLSILVSTIIYIIKI